MTAVPTWIKSTVPYFYRYQSPARLDWLQTIVLQHELYIPLVSQLNDPADGRPKLAELITSRNPTLASDAQRDAMALLAQNIQCRGVDESRDERRKCCMTIASGTASILRRSDGIISVCGPSTQGITRVTVWNF